MRLMPYENEIGCELMNNNMKVPQVTAIGPLLISYLPHPTHEQMYDTEGVSVVTVGFWLRPQWLFLRPNRRRNDYF